MLSFPMTRPPNLPTTIYGCPPEQSEGSASFPVSTCPPLPLSPRFLSSRAPFPILVPFVFNSLRTLLQFSALFCTASPTPPLCFQSLTHSLALLGGRGGVGSPPQSDVIPTAARDLPFLYLLHFLNLLYLPLSNSFRIRTSKPTPRFTVSWPQSPTRKPFRIRTSKIRACNLFRIRTCKKHGGGTSCRIS